MKKIIAAVCAIAVAVSASQTGEDRNKANAIAAVNETLGSLNTEKIKEYFADPYIQHNPTAASGVDGLAGLIENAAKAVGGDPDKINVKVLRVFSEGNIVVMHNVWEGFGPVDLVTFDVFRFNDDGMIFEHWDNMAPRADKPNPSGRTQIDGETEVTDLDATYDNKALVANLITRGFIKGEKIDYTKYINPAKYIQHNTDAADGLDGLGALLKAQAEAGKSMVYKRIGLLVGQGNFVLAGSEGTMGGTPTAFYDLFRLEDGRIVEHWDVISEIPTENLPKGFMGKF